MNNCSWHIVLFERSLWSSEAQQLEEFPSKAEEARQAFSVLKCNLCCSFSSVLVSLIVKSSSAKEIHWLWDHETEDKVLILPDGTSTPDLHKVLIMKSGEDGLPDPESVWSPSKDWDVLHPGKPLVDEEFLLCSLRVAEGKGKNWNKMEYWNDKI